ncbi:hypothetical protein [Arenibacter palladensis]|uniref:hypothetical protein n=1 Tax=Arenibacter palladensis TaxID=237373 RepID=UPI0026E196C2|nr:hypothetical protein [Arenibacter palladensis]MDO6604342.1 hypothetical protein [Arenibacter palladensis]
MIKKIMLIGLFTGLAHILSFYGVSFVVKMDADKFFVSKIAEIESGIAIMLAVMSFGLQQVATRDIAINSDWTKILFITQQNRFSMGLFLSVLGLFLYLLTKDSYYLIFLLAPLLALNVDYALYGRGHSVQASFLSLIKVGVPAVILVILGYIGLFELNIYIISIVVSWGIISYFSNKILKAFLLIRPKLNFFKAYLKNIKIGFTDFALTVLKLGILTLAKPFYDETTIANAFVVLKLYVLIKGVQRVIFQAFYKDLVNPKKAFMIDKIGLLIGFLFFSVTLFYPTEITNFLFSKDYLSSKKLLTLVGIATLISSISISISPRMLLIRKDKEYINSYLFALVGTLSFLVIISKTNMFFYGIIGAILFGEFILNLLFFYHLKNVVFTKQRFLFLLELAGLFTIFSINFCFFNSPLSMFLSAVCCLFYGLYFLFQHKKQIL